jgi:hypothetical protein
MNESLLKFYYDMIFPLLKKNKMYFSYFLRKYELSLGLKYEKNIINTIINYLIFYYLKLIYG